MRARILTRYLVDAEGTSVNSLLEKSSDSIRVRYGKLLEGTESWGLDIISNGSEWRGQGGGETASSFGVKREN